MADEVNHPPHYTSHPSGVECIEIAERLGFNIGNAVKYIFRRDLKGAGAVIDLRKAIWYITRELQRRSIDGEMASVSHGLALRSLHGRESSLDSEEAGEKGGSSQDGLHEHGVLNTRRARTTLRAPHGAGDMEGAVSSGSRSVSSGRSSKEQRAEQSAMGNTQEKLRKKSRARNRFCRGEESSSCTEVGQRPGDSRRGNQSYSSYGHDFQCIDNDDSSSRIGAELAERFLRVISYEENTDIQGALMMLWRAGLKNSEPQQDLEKSIWFIKRELQRISKVSR